MNECPRIFIKHICFIVTRVSIHYDVLKTLACALVDFDGRDKFLYGTRWCFECGVKNIIYEVAPRGFARYELLETASSNRN